MTTINPYLNFAGQTEEAFNFYKSIFGGKFTALQRFGETPEAGNVPDNEKDKLMHISLPVGNNIMMGTETGAHIHGFTSENENADVLFTLPETNPKIGVWNYDEEDEAKILAGQTYVNIHSEKFPAGEIRGQIKVD